LFPFYREGNYDAERLSNLSKVPQLVNGREDSNSGIRLLRPCSQSLHWTFVSRNLGHPGEAPQDRK
jgi:hypothetical protein